MIYLIYITDNWHSHNSKELIAISTSNGQQGPITLIKKYISKNKFDKISKDDMYNLVNILQTQNYTEDFEFIIEEVETNTLL
jgi:hypothetical protein